MSPTPPHAMIPLLAQTPDTFVMSKSEYLSVVIGLVVGLSLTRILTCLSTALPKVPGDRRSLTHTLLLAATFIFQVNYWWNLYNDEVIERISFWGYLLILTVPLLMYHATAVLTPEFNRSATPQVNFQELLQDRVRTFYVLVMGVLLMIIAQGCLIWQDVDRQPLTYALRGGVLLLILLLHRFRHALVQFGLALILLLAMLAYTALTPEGFRLPSLFER